MASEILLNMTAPQTVSVPMTENEILKIFKRLAKDENKCVIIVTHSQNVCNEVDTVYELGK